MNLCRASHFSQWNSVPVPVEVRESPVDSESHSLSPSQGLFSCIVFSFPWNIHCFLLNQLLASAYKYAHVSHILKTFSFDLSIPFNQSPNFTPPSTARVVEKAVSQCRLHLLAHTSSWTRSHWASIPTTPRRPHLSSPQGTLQCQILVI